MQTIPAVKVDKEPKFRFAVISTHKDSSIAELESSFDSMGQASNMFDRQYSMWGLLNTNFYLVDWQEQHIISSHVTYTA
jgi:hypothetical protein